MREKEKLLSEINKINRRLDELTVYLERDPADPNLLGLFRDYLDRRRKLLELYEPVYGRLSLDCREDESAQENKGKLSLGRIYFIWHDPID